MSELICNFQFSKDAIDIPTWALEYLLTQPLRDILHTAAFRTEHEIVPLDAEICNLRRLDIKRILRRRWIEVDSNGDYGNWSALSVYQDRTGSVVPLVMIKASYKTMLTEPLMPLRDQDCAVEAQWPQRLSGMNVRSICTMFVVDDESGQRLHLRPHSSNVRFPHGVNTMLDDGESLETCFGILEI